MPPLSEPWPIDSSGAWRQYFVARGGGSPRVPILFLDRDGVLVEEVHYLHRPEDTRVYPPAINLIRRFNAEGWRVVVVTNQAGIGRGYYGWADFSAVNEHLLKAFSACGAVIDGVLAAPHHADGIGRYQVVDHPMRKPNPGMFLDAIAYFGADAEKSIVIGDRASDLRAGQSAGLGRGILVRTGYGCAEEQSVRALSGPSFRIEVIDNLDLFPADWLA